MKSISLNFVCYLSYIIVYNVLLLCFFPSDTQQPPMYHSTAMPCNTTDALVKQYSGPSSAPQADFTTPYPATTNNCSPQPHPLNNGIAPNPTDGANPATMGIAQPPPYPSTTAYDNPLLLKGITEDYMKTEIK